VGVAFFHSMTDMMSVILRSDKGYSFMCRNGRNVTSPVQVLRLQQIADWHLSPLPVGLFGTQVALFTDARDFGS